MKPKPIKQFSTGDGRNGLFVCAESKAHAVRLLTEATGTRWTLNHFRDYASPRWGDTMKAITPEIGVWIEKPRFSGKVTRLL